MSPDYMPNNEMMFASSSTVNVEDEVYLLYESPIKKNNKPIAAFQNRIDFENAIKLLDLVNPNKKYESITIPFFEI